MVFILFDQAMMHSLHGQFAWYFSVIMLQTFIKLALNYRTVCPSGNLIWLTVVNRKKDFLSLFLGSLVHKDSGHKQRQDRFSDV